MEQVLDMTWQRADEVLTLQSLHANSTLGCSHGGTVTCIAVILPVAWVTFLEAISHVSLHLSLILLEDELLESLKNLSVCVVDLALWIAVKELLLVLPKGLRCEADLATTALG